MRQAARGGAPVRRARARGPARGAGHGRSPARAGRAARADGLGVAGAARGARRRLAGRGLAPPLVRGRLRGRAPHADRRAAASRSRWMPTLGRRRRGARRTLPARARRRGRRGSPAWTGSVPACACVAASPAWMRACRACSRRASASKPSCSRNSMRCSSSAGDRRREPSTDHLDRRARAARAHDGAVHRLRGAVGRSAPPARRGHPAARATNSWRRSTRTRPGSNRARCVEGTGRSLSVNLGPGLLGGIFDGLLRPLTGTDDFEIQARHRRARARALPVHAGGRRRARELKAGHDARDRGRRTAAVDPGAAGLRRAARVDRAGGRVPGGRADRRLVRRRRHAATSRDAPRVAGAHAAPGREAPAGQRADDHRPAHPRHAVPGRARRPRRAARRLRHRQDRAAGSARQVVRRRRDRLRRLRRARQRDGRGARRVPEARGPAHRPAAGRAHGDHRQHVEHAGRGARGEHLHGDLGRRVFPRPGPARRADGRLDEPLGRGAARGLGAPGRAARRSGLSRVPQFAARRVLRARGARRRRWAARKARSRSSAR